ncbi:DMSO/selenate family reductase complex B subunit [Campylobacter gastrosuis]|uniref:Dimethylsulfoxide reductase subunit B n=1 Tax=Campylobacter gastrosuis TaxID=2974576 RepID=A0ABT7HQ69_9BACT|nr:DMSO/selenate family reductase complex B subunit [Campylobacter gastrosuis]MDL0088974.1 dimethylsulfoxide reductase subunit B [Campylobacter gastrosuis]
MKKDEQFGFVFDQSRCVGCRTCVMACKEYKNNLIGVNFRRVYEYEGGECEVGENGVIMSNNVFAYYTSISCNHCSNPACMKACPTGAMIKTRYGIVMVNESDCVGCKACAIACPYGAPQFNKKSGHMNKCDGCIDRIDEGKSPVCVGSCPFRALNFGEIGEIRSKYGSDASFAPLPDASVTLANFTIIPEKHSRKSGNKGGAMHLPQSYQGVEDEIL